MVVMASPSSSAVVLSIIVAVALFSCTSAIKASTNGSITVTYAEANGNSPIGSADLSLQSLSRSVYGVAPDQIHVTYWGNSSYLISWATGDGQVGPGVQPPPTGGVQSCVLIGLTAALNASADPSVTMHLGIALTYVFNYSGDVTNGNLGADYINIPGQQWLAADYASPLLHHVLVEGLMPNKTYHYQVGDPRFYYGMSSVISFTTLAVRPPNNGTAGSYALPFRLGVMADVGQSYNTSAMINKMLITKMDAVALIGDFTYADNYGADGCLYYNYLGSNVACPWSLPEGTVGEQTYQPRWDTWGRLMQSLISKVPFLFSVGNHELEELSTGARFTSVNARYPGPPAKHMYPATMTNKAYLDTIVQNQISDNEFDPRGSYHNMFYSVEAPGSTLIYITSFIGGDDFGNDSVQYMWLAKTLAAVDRARTPWVIVNFHFPMYSSYHGTYKGAECFRQAYEPLLFQYGVDIVFNGHVHSYERTNPTYNLSLNACGIVHIIVGDGGNNEGIAPNTFIDTDPNGFCKPGKMTTRFWPDYQPQACYSLNPVNAANPLPGAYCDSKQPVWSAYRNPSWGFGVLEIINSTTALWVWDNTDNDSTAQDIVYLTRNSASCMAGGDK